MAEIKMYKSIFNENTEELDEKKKKKDKGEMDPAQQILEILSSKKFLKWFEGKFADYKAGEEGAPTEEEIMEDITNTFIAPMEEAPEEETQEETLEEGTIDDDLVKEALESALEQYDGEDEYKINPEKFKTKSDFKSTFKKFGHKFIKSVHKDDRKHIDSDDIVDEFEEMALEKKWIIPVD